MQPILLRILFAGSILILAQHSPAADRSAIPGKPEQIAALKQIKELFAADYANSTPRARQALADKLLKTANDSEDPIARYVLLSETRDIAGGIGNARASLAAAAKIEALYESHHGEAMLVALALLKKSTLSAVAAGDAAIAAIGSIDSTLAGGDLEAAGKLAAAIDGIAGYVSDPQLAGAARQRSTDVRAAMAESGRLTSDRKLLQDQPGDPKANLTVGKFVAFTLGQWNEGCRLLTSASDPTLRDLAILDRSDAADPKIALKVGDGWMTIAETSHGLAHAHLVERSLKWYRRALPGLIGLEKLRVAKRIAAGASIKPWDSGIYTTNSDGKGIDIGMPERNASHSCLIQFDVKTTQRSAVLLTKRKKESDSSLTIELTSHGAVNVADDGSFYKEDSKGKIIINDGNWHTIRIEKQDKVLKLFIDSMPDGVFEVRSEIASASPWTLGWHETWQNGALDAEFRHVRIEGGK